MTTRFKRAANGRTTVSVCHWCKLELKGLEVARTLPAWTDWPDLPRTGTVRVCGADCPQRPDGAPVGTALAGA